jgi:hypothetical protein
VHSSCASLLFMVAAVAPVLAGSASAAEPRPAGVAITHGGVDCVLAAQHPVIDACFAPAAGVGRAQVQFRAVESGPWYAVDMKPEGACHRALLPRPRRETKTFRYFIQVIDRGFNATVSPATAPGVAHGPRVVASKVECGQTMMMAPLAEGARPIVVGIVRDAAGKALDAAAAAKLEPSAALGGFSPDGVTMATTGARPSPTSGAQVAAAGAGGGLGTLAIVGGAAAAAAGVGVAVGTRGGGDPPSPGPAPGPAPAPAPAPSSGDGSLTGRWSGTAANGAGFLVRLTGGGVACTLAWDVTADLTQSGTSVTGPLTVAFQVLSCQPPEADEAARPFLGTVKSVAFNATVTPPGGLAFAVDGLVFTGTFTNTTIDLTATLPDPSFAVVYTLRMVRR